MFVTKNSSIKIHIISFLLNHWLHTMFIIEKDKSVCVCVCYRDL